MEVLSSMFGLPSILPEKFAEGIGIFDEFSTIYV
jgi:hypothetical protein